MYFSSSGVKGLKPNWVDETEVVFTLLDSRPCSLYSSQVCSCLVPLCVKIGQACAADLGSRDNSRQLASALVSGQTQRQFAYISTYQVVLTSRARRKRYFQLVPGASCGLGQLAGFVSSLCRFSLSGCERVEQSSSDKLEIVCEVTKCAHF